MKPSKLSATAAAALFTVSVFGAYGAVSLGSEADARTRRVQGSVSTNRGVYNGASETTRNRGSRNRDATVTGPNGGSRTVEDRRTWGEGAYAHDRTTTYGDGSQRTVDTDAVRTGDNTFSVNRDVTGRNGEVRNQSGDFTVERTETGRTVTGDISTTNAGEIDYSRSVNRGDGSRSVDATATFEDGTSIRRSSSGSCADGACSSSGEIVNRNGGVTTWDASRARTEDGSVYSRDVTYPDGTTRSVDRVRTGNGDGTGTIERTVTGRNGESRTQTGEYAVTVTPEP